MSSSVDQIKSKIDIVSLISSYIKLEKAGTNFKGRCPFHNEKTPSFFVSPDRGSYYCFGCHVKGDIFTFVQEFEGLDFIGSLKVLADRAGVKLEKYGDDNKSNKDRLHNVLEQAVLFYQNKLEENRDAKEYLVKRGVNKETIESFRIGFAPLEWRDLLEHLASKNVSLKDMSDVGLIKKSTASLDSNSKETNSSYYDTFRGRIMFPINDSSGRVVGFSGRILISDDKSPKYLNSPETTLFNKSEILFGMDKAKSSIKIKDYSILVEGQMDLIMLHQVGITNTVASSGTALTESHLIKLRRLSNRIIMAYDGDKAGFAASNRSSQIALSLGMDLKIASMPEGMDPADLAKDDMEALVGSLKNSKHIIDFYVDSLLTHNIDSRKIGQEVEKNVLPYVAMLPSTIEKSYFIKSISQKTFIKEDALWDELNKKQNHVNIEKTYESKSPPIKRTDAIERKVVGIILWQKDKKEIDIESIETKVGHILGDRLIELLDYFEKSEVGEKEKLLFEIESYYDGKKDLEKDIQYLILSLEEEYLKKIFSIRMNNLQDAERAKNKELIAKYLQECQEISQKINAIKQQYEK